MLNLFSMQWKAQHPIKICCWGRHISTRKCLKLNSVPPSSYSTATPKFYQKLIWPSTYLRHKVWKAIQYVQEHCHNWGMWELDCWVKARKLSCWVLAELLWANTTTSSDPITSCAPWCLAVCCLLLKITRSLRQGLRGHSTFVWLFV